jgi:hypothetical protein
MRAALDLHTDNFFFGLHSCPYAHDRGCKWGGVKRTIIKNSTEQHTLDEHQQVCTPDFRMVQVLAFTLFY